MDMKPKPGIESAEIVLPAADLDANVKFFTERLGFRLDAIFPADDPAVALVSGHGLRLRFEREAKTAPGALRLVTRGAAETLTAPNGTRIELAKAEPTVVLPPVRQSYVLQKLASADAWIAGRAGMLYRDLIPGRQNGRFIASHIRIPEGGPVPDYVHFHKIRFQMIYCVAGWVRLVYEDQGPPFVMRAGDCVLQPPEIRHRVLESSGGLEVVEIGCPAEHITCVEHEMPLPNGAIDTARNFAGQRFVHHVAAEAAWKPWRIAGFIARDTGIGAATGGLAGVMVARASGAPRGERVTHKGEFLLDFVLGGSATLEVEGHGRESLAAGDAVTIPAGLAYAFSGCSPDFELLDVTLPAA